MIQLFSIVDRSGSRRPAIFVFRKAEFTDEDDDGKEPEAVYWLKR